jgi:hypothetical protein
MIDVFEPSASNYPASQGATATRPNFRRFFGIRFGKREFQDGPNGDAIAHITV